MEITRRKIAVPVGGRLRRIASHLGMMFALAAALIWVPGTRVDAQGSKASISVATAAPTSTSSSANAAMAPAPVIVAAGAQFANVRGLATDPAGRLYVSLSATPPAKNCVTSSMGAASGSAKLMLTIFSNCMLAPSEDPSGIAVGPGNKMFLANRAQNTIRLLDMLSGKVAALPLGLVTRAGSTASSNLDPFQPAGLSSDAQGNLYVADRGNNRILGLAPNAAHFSYLAHVLDAAAVAVDSKTQRVYVAAPAANRVFAIDLSTGNVTAFAGSGVFTNASNGNPASEFASAPENVQLGAPEGVVVDAKGNVFISDTEANAVVRVDAKSGMLSRVALNQSLSSPGALAIDCSGDVFVADRGNARIVEFPQLGAEGGSTSITISPSSFDFGAELTGGSTAAQQFTLTNNSSSAISLSNTSFTFTGPNAADYTQTNNCVPSVAVGASCQINVTFTPGHTGSSSATLEVTDSDPSSPQIAALSGTGDDFQLTVPTVTDMTQNVIPGNNATYTVSVTPDSLFSGTVNLQCPAVLSAKTATIGCTIQPTTVSVTPNTPQQFTVTLTTAGPNATQLVWFGRRIGPNVRTRVLLLCIFAVMLTLFYFRMRFTEALSNSAVGKKPRVRMAVLCFAMLVATAAAGCGYSNPVNPNETPVGSFAIVITGTAQNGGRSITLILNVD